MRTTVTVSKEVWRRARADAIRKALSWDAYLALAVEGFYNSGEKINPAEADDKKRFPIEVPRDTWRRVKLMAAAQMVTASEVLEAALRWSLKNEQSP